MQSCVGEFAAFNNDHHVVFMNELVMVSLHALPAFISTDEMTDKLDISIHVLGDKIGAWLSIFTGEMAHWGMSKSRNRYDHATSKQYRATVVQ